MSAILKSPALESVAVSAESVHYYRMNEIVSSSLPRQFVWTRYGTEAGESIDLILSRKDLERYRNGGIFLWGIGNAVGKSIRELVRAEAEPRVIFSPMRSPPKPIDIAPNYIAKWTRATTLMGAEWLIPEHSIVTSRLSESRRKRTHYALVCKSTSAIQAERKDRSVAIGNLRNLITGKPVGSSQVTAVVAICDYKLPGSEYEIGFIADLVFPFFVVLSEPVKIPMNCLVTEETSGNRKCDARDTSESQEPMQGVFSL